MLIRLETLRILLLIVFFTVLLTVMPANPSVHVVSSVKAEAALTQVFISSIWAITLELPSCSIADKDWLSWSMESLTFAMQSLMIATSLFVNPWFLDSFDIVEEQFFAAFKDTERAVLQSFWGFASILEAKGKRSLLKRFNLNFEMRKKL